MNHDDTPSETLTDPVAHIFDPAHRALSVGILLGVTLFAFEALAVVTIAPRFAADSAARRSTAGSSADFC